MMPGSRGQLAMQGGGGIELIGIEIGESDLSTTTVSVNVPGGTEDGDLMVAVYYSYNQDNNALPAGWASAFFSGGAFPRLNIAWRIAASEPALYNFSRASSYKRVSILTYRGAIQIGVVGDISRLEGTPVVVTAPSLNAPAAGLLLGLFFHQASSARIISDPPGMVRIQDEAVWTGAVGGGSIFEQHVSSGPTGDRSVTWDSTSSSSKTGILLHIE